MKKLEFFQRQLETKDPQIFRAAVIDVKNFGLLVELPDVVLTGMIHISALIDDFYVFNGAQRQLIGRQSRRRFSIGDQLQVYVARVDVFKRQVDFAIADSKPQKKPVPKPAKTSRRRR